MDTCKQARATECHALKAGVFFCTMGVLGAVVGLLVYVHNQLVYIILNKSHGRVVWFSSSCSKGNYPWYILSLIHI